MRRVIGEWIFIGGLALPAGAIAAGAVADMRPHDTMSDEVRDARREMQILTAFSRNPHLRAFDFSVSVVLDRVVLGGTVDDGSNKNLAERIATGVDGIRFVANHIVVDADCARSQRATSD